MDLIAVILVDGLIYGAWLFIVSVGLTLVFGVLNILNMAHGSLYAMGAYATATAVGLYLGVGGEAFPMGSYAAMIVATLVVAFSPMIFSASQSSDRCFMWCTTSW